MKQVFEFTILLDINPRQAYNTGMTIELHSDQKSLHLSLSEETLLGLCNVQKLTAASRQKILHLLDAALPEMLETYLNESDEIQTLLAKKEKTSSFKPV